MKYDVRKCRILKKTELAKGIFDVTVEAGSLAANAVPGQFAHLHVPGKTLRRPISICEIDREAGTLRLVFQVRGEGTERLASFSVGEEMDLLAPLGNGFALGETARRAVFVGGGIGVPPLLGAARAWEGPKTAVLGFRSRELLILKDDFEACGCEVRIATEDGSAGVQGLVTDCMKDVTAQDAVFACGPTPMLRAVAQLAEKRGAPCQVSLEERMACGVGACLGCAVRLHRDGNDLYGHVCKDGPVFSAREVRF